MNPQQLLQTQKRLPFIVIKMESLEEINAENSDTSEVEEDEEQELPEIKYECK